MPTAGRQTCINFKQIHSLLIKTTPLCLNVIYFFAENVGLPEVPSITVVLPPKYPSISPTCDLTHYQTNPSPFIKQVGMLLSEKLSKKTCVYPLTAILDNWELSILRVISEELNSDDDEDD